MTTNSFNFDKEVAGQHLRAAGWDLNNFNHSNPFNSNAFYVSDFRFNAINLLTIDVNDFNSVEPPKDVPVGALATCISELLVKYYAKKSGLDIANQLAPILISYIKKTETFAVWRKTSKPGERLHVLLNIYPVLLGECLVRPCIVKSDASYLRVDDVKKNSHYLRERDKQNNPSWCIS